MMAVEATTCIHRHISAICAFHVILSGVRLRGTESKDLERLSREYRHDKP